MRRPLILLATYNGERFLPQLIASIEGQTFTQWTLLARDDGSADATRDLLEAWAARDDRVTVLRKQDESLCSACSNFSALMVAAASTDCDYFFFCDQDDQWEPAKVARCLSAFDGAPGGPQLVVSDLMIVDSSGAVITGNFWQSIIMPPKNHRTVAELCSRNLYPGCSMALNRDLLLLVSEVPDEAIMHDWWVAIIASATSEIIEIDEALLLYRQHSENHTGVTSWWRELKAFTMRGEKGNVLFRQSFEQARTAAERLNEHGYGESTTAPIAEYAALVTLAFGVAVRKMWALRIRRYHPALFLVFLFRLLVNRRFFHAVSSPK